MFHGSSGALCGHSSYPRFILLILLFALLSGIAFAADTPSPAQGVDRISALLSLICKFLTDILPVLALVLFLFAGITYASGNFLGASAEMRAKLQNWMTSSLTAGVTMLVIYLVAPVLVTLTTGTEFCTLCACNKTAVNMTCPIGSVSCRAVCPFAINCPLDCCTMRCECSITPQCIGPDCNYSWTSCKSGFSDCNSDGTPDCNTSNSSNVCFAGICKPAAVTLPPIDTCAEGWSDCDKNISTGSPEWGEGCECNTTRGAFTCCGGICANTTVCSDKCPMGCCDETKCLVDGKCCLPSEEDCQDSTDCCSSFCNILTGKCECNRNGRECSENAECCGFLTSPQTARCKLFGTGKACCNTNCPNIPACQEGCCNERCEPICIQPEDCTTSRCCEGLCSSDTNQCFCPGAGGSCDIANEDRDCCPSRNPGIECKSTSIGDKCCYTNCPLNPECQDACCDRNCNLIDPGATCQNTCTGTSCRIACDEITGECPSRQECCAGNLQCRICYPNGICGGIGPSTCISNDNCSEAVCTSGFCQGIIIPPPPYPSYICPNNSKSDCGNGQVTCSLLGGQFECHTGACKIAGSCPSGYSDCAGNGDCNCLTSDGSHYCCGGECRTSECINPEGNCMFSSQCCPSEGLRQICNSTGRCASCLADAALCQIGVDCCSGVCAAGQCCGGQWSCCTREGQDCHTNEECCAGLICAGEKCVEP